LKDVLEGTALNMKDFSSKPEMEFSKRRTSRPSENPFIRDEYVLPTEEERKYDPEKKPVLVNGQWIS